MYITIKMDGNHNIEWSMSKVGGCSYEESRKFALEILRTARASKRLNTALEAPELRGQSDGQKV
jgi:hypothetical protein